MGHDQGNRNEPQAPAFTSPDRFREETMRQLILAIALCALIGGCALRSETVVQKPVPAADPVVVSAPPPTTVVVTDPPTRTVYVPTRY